MKLSNAVGKSQVSKKTRFPITPERFWQVFASELRKDFVAKRQAMRRRFKDFTPRTKYMTKLLDTRIKGHFSGTMQSKNCYEGEFWPRIDVAYFDKPNGLWDPWALEVAIEHENDPAVGTRANEKWHEECCKLLLLNAGLKVLITYRWVSDAKLKRALGEFKKILP